MEAENSPYEDPTDQTTLIEDSRSIEQCRGKRFFGLTVEPVLFLAMFGSNMSGILLTNLLLVRSCEYMKLDNCSSMDSQSGGPDEKIVEPYVAKLNMYKLIFESVSPAIMAFFIGPWSDKYGRRPLLLAPLLGYCLNFILLIVFTWFNLAPLFILLTSAPLVLLGGSMTFFTGAFCYVNDVTPLKNLPFQLAVTEGMLYLGFLCGNISAPYLFYMFPSHGYEAIFGISLAVCFCALLYVAFLLPESIVDENEHSNKERLKALFDYRQVVALFQVCFGNHNGYSRPVRLITVGVTLLTLISLEGTIAVGFLFSRNKFAWDVKQFSLYTDAVFIMNICGLMFGAVVFSKWCKIPSAPLSGFAYILKAAGYVIGGLSSYGWCLYLGSAVGSLGGMTSPLNRAIMSETLPKKDIGKLFSIVSAFNTAVPIVAGLSYTMLYNSTIDSFPGAVYLLSAALSTICSVLLGVVVILQVRNSQLTPL